MNETCDVLLTYGWNRLTYNILRNLTKNGLKVVVGDESRFNMSSMSRFSSASFQYPSPFLKQDEFIENLIAKIKKYKPRVLIPGHEESFIIAKYIDRFPQDIIIPIPDFNTLMMAHDKTSASKIANELDVPVPHIYSVNSEADLQNNKQNFKYPLVIKLPNSNAAKGVFYAHDFNELLKIYRENYDSENVPYVQDYVHGDGYGASFLYNKGTIVTGFIHKRLVEKTYTGGVSVKRVSVKNELLYNYGKKILDKLKWNGPAMIEFKYDEKCKQAWFIEINARYWGSLALPIAAGLDIPYWHFQSALGKKIEPNDYKEGVTSIWVLGIFITLAERLIKRKLSFKEFKSLMKFKCDNYDDLKKDDIRAFFGEIIYYFSRFIKSGSINPKLKGMGKF